MELMRTLNQLMRALRGLEPDVFEFSAQRQIHYVFNDVTIRCVHNASTICVIFPAFNDELSLRRSQTPRRNTDPFVNT
jgi:hypothetical protein